MARKLKPGDRVTVAGEVKFSKTSDAFKAGLQVIQPGEIGQVVNDAEGRAVYAEFNGIRALVSKRRLTIVKGKDSTAKGKRGPGRKAKNPAESTVTASGGQAFGTQLINILANRLLSTGNTNPDDNSVVELRLGDLPADIRERVITLIEAKLALSI